MSEDNNNSASQSDWKKRELGALWRREGKKQNYLSGILKIGDFGVERELRVVVFTNKGKAKNEKAPDFIMYEEKAREDINIDPVAKVEASSEPAPQEADEDIPTVLQ